MNEVSVTVVSAAGLTGTSARSIKYEIEDRRAAVANLIMAGLSQRAAARELGVARRTLRDDLAALSR